MSMRVKKTRLSAEVLERREVPTAGLDYTFGPAGRTLIPISDRIDIGTDAQQRILVVEPIADGVVVLRFTPNGLPDTSFGSQGVALFHLDDAKAPPNKIPPTTIHHFVPTEFVIDGAGRIVIGGSNVVDQGAAGSQSYFAVLGLTADGDLDTSFDVDGISPLPVADGVTGVALTPDGKIVVAGQSQVARLTDNGSLDVTFDGDGVQSVQTVGDPSNPLPFVAADVGVDGSGRVVVTGEADGQIGVVRLATDGQFDATYGVNGAVFVPLDIVPGDPT